MPRASGAIDTLRRSLSGEVSESPERRTALSRDASSVAGWADAVVRPEGVEDLQRLIAWARPRRVPVTARGGGTSLDGESVPVAGGVVVDLSGWDRVLEIDPVDGLARIGPGISQPALEAALERHGLTYPVNPGSGPASTLGGHVATNASGPRSFRHGSTRAWVRSLLVVDGRARRWTAGGRVRKRSIGPDLVGLLVGSEGTLGIFAEIGVRIAPRPSRRLGIAVPLPAGAPVGRLAADLPRTLGPGTSAVEYVDAAADRAMSAPFGEGSAPLGWLLAEVEGEEADVYGSLGRLESARSGLGLADPPAIFESADRLWTRRGEAGTAVARSLGESVREDIVVPVSALDRLLGELRAMARSHAVPLAVFGHVGEGNLHPSFGLNPRSPAAGRLRDELLDRVLALGGAISGEHGIGVTKRGHLRAQLGDPGLELLRAVKANLDPAGILNPGKLLPDARPSAARRSVGSPSASAAPRAPRGRPTEAPGSRTRGPAPPAAPRRTRGARP